MASSRSRRVGAAVAAALLAAGCDLTLPWSTGTAPDAPRDLTATEVDPLDIDLVVVSWTATGAEQECELEGRVGSGDWQVLLPRGPVFGPSIPVRLDAAVPERASLAFRLRVWVAGKGSGWSEEAGMVRGIRAPSAFSAVLRTSASTRCGPVTLAWTNASQVATVVELERSRLDGAGTPMAWAPLAGASLAAGTYVDQLLEDGAAYAYRLRVGVDGAWSGRRQAGTEAVDLAAPSGLRAFVDGAVVRLTWTNRSAAAESLTVSRYTRGWPWWDFNQDLPATATTWTEAMPVWPVATYDVAAKRPSAFLYAPTVPVQLEPFTLPGPPALAASVRRLPGHTAAARDAAGRFHLAQDSVDGPRLHRATDGGYDTHLLPASAGLVDPGVLLDGAGAPHSAFLRPAASGAGTDLAHVWWDGSAWQEELVVTDDVAPWVSNMPRAWFGIDVGGAVQVLYRRSAAAGEELVHVARSGGAWTSATVATPSIPGFNRWSAAFSVAADGTAAVAMIGQTVSPFANLIALCTRSAAGAWSDEVVPAAPDFSFSGPWVVAANGGDAAVASFAYLGDGRVEVVRRQGGTWGTPETVVSQASTGYTPDLRLARSADLGRLAVLATASGTVGVHVRDAAGWRSVVVGPGTSVWGALGLGASGAWALIAHDSAGGGAPLPYSLFEEVP